MSAPRTRTRPLDPARFATPEAGDRPGARWWWQSAVPVEELVRQLGAIADAGFREVEIAFSRGFWADDRQRSALGSVLREAERIGVGVAMTLGASWPLKTPNTTTGTGFSTRELQYGSVRLADGESGPVRVPMPFDDVDGERPSTLIRVTAARVVQRNDPPTVVPLGDPYAPPRGVVTPPDASTVLETDSLIDLTSQVVDSTIVWERRDGDWTLFAFWMRDCTQGVTSFLDRSAALAATEYLDEHQIGAENRELVHRVGTELFEDSLELNADSLFWTSEMLERFSERHGYDVTPYLPLLFAHGMCRFWVPNEEPMPDFELDTGVGVRVRRDYYRLLTDLYISDHLLPLQNWSAGHGMRHKSQLAYGQSLEAIRGNREFVRAGGRAEGESLNSGDRTPIDRSNSTWRFALDWQRSVVGGAHQGGAVRISTELGAQFRAAYAFTLGDLQRMLAKEWAAGITKPFLHGVASQEPGSAWPTQTRFEQHIVSDSWNETHFPEWANWPGLTDYWARGTVVLETGIPRTDVAVYRDGFLTIAARGVRDTSLDATAPARHADTEALENVGFTVQFVDPIGLAEAATVGDDGTLFPDGPAYRGLIVDERTLPPEAAEAIAAAAERGARVVVVGEPPAADSGFAGGGTRAGARDEHVRTAMARTLAQPSTVQVSTMSEAADAFTHLGLVPRAAVDAASLLSQWREAGSCRYVLVYNTLREPACVTLSLEGVGRVRELDLIGGRVLAAAHRAERGRTAVPTQIPGLGVRVFELDLSVAPEPLCDDNATTEIELTPEGWRIEVTSEEPSGPRTIALDGVGPQDWRDVDALRHVSGTGRYTARAVIPEELVGLPTVIHLGGLAGSAVVRIGDRVVGTAYVDDTVIDLGEGLTNRIEIEIEVRTALRNAVIASGISGLIGADSTQPQGLIGPVRIVVTSVAGPGPDTDSQPDAAPERGHDDTAR
ncbi:glycosyl hydrolase [Humibacter sp. RRB41]|uniref:glycosyl hydrolase n=1 Tax=Humibacter sp. RRB41 TaxID=2919946 RepID=UPI001FA9DD2C|nr:glycosyl hydrolase [Humibacter sp. RRB41]